MTVSVRSDVLIEATLSAVRETAVGLLGCERVEFGEVGTETITTPHFGALVQLASERELIQTAIVSTQRGAAELAAAMLFDDPDNLSDEDVADAVGEILNIIGGVVEQATTGDDHMTELGLPIVFEGRLVPHHGAEVITIPARFDGTQTDILITRERPQPEA